MEALHKKYEILWQLKSRNKAWKLLCYVVFKAKFLVNVFLIIQFSNHWSKHIKLIYEERKEKRKNQKTKVKEYAGTNTKLKKKKKEKHKGLQRRKKIPILLFLRLSSLMKKGGANPGLKSPGLRIMRLFW